MQGRENWYWSTWVYLVAKHLHNVIWYKETQNMHVCRYQISHWQAASYRGFLCLAVRQFPFECPERWLLHGDRQQRDFPRLRIWNGCHHTMVSGFSLAWHCKDVKNSPPGAAQFVPTAAKKMLSFWWVFFWGLYNGCWHAWRKASVSELSVFPQHSLHFSRRKIEFCFPISFQIVPGLPKYPWGCLMSPQATNECIGTIFLWQVHFNRVFNFTELNNGNRKA